MKLRRPVRAFVLAVIAAGAVALIAAVLTTPISPVPIVLWAALLALATAAQLQAVHVSVKNKVMVGDLPIFASVLITPLPIAMGIGALSTFVGLRFATRNGFQNRLFNASGTLIATGAAGVVYRTLAHGPSLLDDPLAIGLAAATSYLVKSSITDLVIALQLRRDPVRGWWSTHRREIWYHAALYLLGVLAAVSAERQVWTLLLFLVPLALILVALRETTRLRQRTRDAIVELADVIDRRDTYTYGHSQRVAELSARLARHLKLPAERVDLITEAARMHDIGKISIPDRILKKPGPLTSSEWEEMRRHCEIGHRFLLQLPDFADGAELVLCHHERVDGGGYPRGLAGTELSLDASIIAVADAYDAMTTDRVYRPALATYRVIAELRAGRGTQWHGRAVDGMLDLIDEGSVAQSLAPAASAAS
jgi:HD-GYP domain-containing protein (c-di-GMP phosphodiesterase class II)